VALTFDAATVEEAGLESAGGGVLEPRTRLAIALMRRVMIEARDDADTIDEEALHLLAALAREKSGSGPDFSRRAEEVRSLRIDVWLSAFEGSFSNLIAKPVGDRIVLEGTLYDGWPTRWSFNDITERSFLWRGEIGDGDGGWVVNEEMACAKV
jgi:hypothetical protein